MQLFYTQNIIGDTAYLIDEELQHAIKTLRKKTGDIIELMDGKGYYYKTELYDINKKEAKLRILKQEARPLPWDFHLHIALAPTKNADRIEWWVEKAVEIGINEVSLLLCRHSERKQIRIDRLEKIALAAAKQSYKFSLPLIHELCPFDKFIAKEDFGQKFIAHCRSEILPELSHSYNYRPQQSVLVLIGPEGDFTSEEIDLALAADYQEVSLGRSRLRSETAALVACHSLQLLSTAPPIPPSDTSS